MGDGDSRLDVLIRVSSDVAGAAPAQQAVKDVAEETKKAGQTEEEHGKKTHFLAGRKRELQAALQALGRQFPEVGQMARYLFNPLTAGLGIASLLINKTKEGIKQLEETVGITAGWESMASAVEKGKDALAAAKLEASAYERQLRAIGTATENAAQKSEDLLKAHQAQMSAEEKLDEARKKAEIARVEATEKDPVKRAEKLLEIEERHAAKKRKREDDTAAFEMQQRARTLEATKEEGSRLAKELERARGKKAGIESEEEIRDRIEADKVRLKSEEAAQEKRRDRLEELDKKTLDPTDTEWHERRHLTKAIEEGDMTTDKLRGFIKHETKAAQPKIDRARAAEEEVKRIESERLSAEQRRKEQEREFKTAQERTAAEASARHGAAGDESFARRAQAPIGRQAMGDVQEGIDIAKQIGSHKQVTEDSKRRLVEIGSALAGHAVTLETAVAQMEWSAKSQDNFATQAGRLANVMAQLPGIIAPLRGKIDTLEKEVAALRGGGSGAQVHP